MYAHCLQTAVNALFLSTFDGGMEEGLQNGHETQFPQPQNCHLSHIWMHKCMTSAHTRTYKVWAKGLTRVNIMQEHLGVVCVRKRAFGGLFRLYRCVFVRVGSLPEYVLAYGGVFIKLSEQTYTLVRFLPQRLKRGHSNRRGNRPSRQPHMLHVCYFKPKLHLFWYPSEMTFADPLLLVLVRWNRERGLAALYRKGGGGWTKSDLLKKERNLGNPQLPEKNGAQPRRWRYRATYLFQTFTLKTSGLQGNWAFRNVKDPIWWSASGVNLRETFFVRLCVKLDVLHHFLKLLWMRCVKVMQHTTLVVFLTFRKYQLFLP